MSITNEEQTPQKESVRLRIKEKLRAGTESRFGKAANAFCRSVWYPVAVCAVCCFAHSLDLAIVGAMLIAVLLAAALVFCDNSFVLIPPVVTAYFLFSAATVPLVSYLRSPVRIVGLCFAAVVAIAAFAFHIVYYGHWKRLFKRAYCTISMAILTVLLAMGGIGSPTVSWWGVGKAVAIGASMFFPYSVLVNCGKYEGETTMRYFAVTFIAAGAVIAASFLRQMAANGFDMRLQSVKTYLSSGFIGPNTGSAILVLAVPMTFYLIYKLRYGGWLLFLVAAELVVLLAARSRATLAVALPGTLIVSIWLCFQKKTGRLGYRIGCGIFWAVCLAVCLIFRKPLWQQVLIMFKDNTTGSGRTLIWEIGFDAWKKYPVFGAGCWFLRSLGYKYFSFHCTPLTYLFCAGIVGLGAYVYHRYKTVRMTFSAKLTAERVFTALTVLAVIVNALLDTGMTYPMNLLYYSVLLALLECDVLYTKKRGAPPPTESSATETTEKVL